MIIYIQETVKLGICTESRQAMAQDGSESNHNMYYTYYFPLLTIIQLALKVDKSLAHS